MSLQEIQSKIKGWEEALMAKDRLFLLILMVTISAASFGLGRLSVLVSGTDDSTFGRVHMAAIPLTYDNGAPRETASLENTVVAATNTREATAPTEQAISAEEGTYVGSKKGNKYHLPWCAGAQKITEANKVWFKSKEDALQNGYTPAGNCKGI